MVLSYLAFGAGFPARLLGSFLFGHFGDRIGRRWSFQANFLLVGLSTCLTALIPGYDRLGVAAPILLVTLRIIQGIGLGGEFGGATSMLAEHGQGRRHRALWVSLVNLGIPGGAMAASAATYAFSASFAASGWRQAMLISVVLFIPAAIGRHKVSDSPLFARARSNGALSDRPSLAVVKAHARPILLLALLAAFQQMDGYVSGTYMISFMGAAGIPLSKAAILIFVGRIGDLAGVALGGFCAAFVGRRTLAMIAIVTATLLSVPFTLAILGRHILLVGVLQCLITLFGVGILHALAPIIASESFATRYRHSGAGISYSLSAVFGGMLAPSLLAGTIGSDVAGKWPFIPALYLIYGAIALLALRRIGETRGISLQSLDDSGSPGD